MISGHLLETVPYTLGLLGLFLTATLLLHSRAKRQASDQDAGPYRDLCTGADTARLVVDARSGTIGIRIRVENPQKLTLAGLRCNLQFRETE